ncbi:MAG: glycosyltransferase [Anaerolineae bacterium]|nr:glycosyltransferase [Anaerolineae bacterium]
MKDRSILVIDVWMPTPDRDSASLRIVNLLSILEQMVGRVTFGVGDPPHWRTAEKWRPLVQPLQGSMIRLVEGNAAIEAHLKQQGQDYDVVILSRLSVASRYLPTVRRYAPQAAVVFDTTDLHFLRGFRGAKVTGKVNLMRSALLAKKDELALARQADCTLVVSPVEKTILEEECPDISVQVISNIHTAYGSRKPFSERSGIIFVGSFPHHPNVDGMVYFYQDIYPLLKEQLPDITITIIGSDPPEWLKQAADEQFIVTDYVPDIAPYFDHSRLSIAPLRYGAGVKGKVLLSMGYGVPVVASSIAAEGIPVVNGRDMLIADTPASFSEAIVELYYNEALWDQMSANGLKIIDKHFSFTTARQALTDLLNSLGRTVRVEGSDVYESASITEEI